MRKQIFNKEISGRTLSKFLEADFGYYLNQVNSCEPDGSEHFATMQETLGQIEDAFSSMKLKGASTIYAVYGGKLRSGDVLLEEDGTKLLYLGKTSSMDFCINLDSKYFFAGKIQTRDKFGYSTVDKIFSGPQRS